jgi:hypothetical protein
VDEATHKPADGHTPAQDVVAGTKGRQARHRPPHEPSEAERALAAQAVREVTREIKARARGLRRLGYGLLFIVGVLLFGGMGVAFYSQILLITHSTAQQEAVRSAEVTRDADKKKLDDLTPGFDALRDEVSSAAMNAIPPTQQGISTSLTSIQFAADGQRGWAVGVNGTILATKGLAGNYRIDF